jgi:hypothetical protein
MKGLTKHLTTLAIFCSFLFSNAQNMGSIRFHVWSASGLTDECILYIHSNATTDYEGSYDAIKFFSATYKPQVFSVSTDSVALSYNAFPPFHKDTIVPVWFKSSTDTLHSIHANFLSMDSTWTIELHDSLSTGIIDLTSGDSLYFQHQDSVLEARFMLHIGCDVELTIEDSICPSTPSFTLYGNNYENGRFFGDAVVNDSTFDPSLALNGINWVYFESEGCMDVDSSWIYVYPSPSLTLSNDTTIIPGGIVELNASLIPDNPNYSFSWTPSSLVNDPSALQTSSISLYTDVTFTFTVSDTLCGPGSTAELVVTVDPLQASSTYNTPVCSGSQVFLCADLSGGTGNYTISWSPDSLFNDPDSLCSWVWLHDDVDYTAWVSDGNESFYITPTLTVLSLPEVSWDTSFQTCFGEDIVLTEGTPSGGEWQSFQMQDSLFLASWYPAGDYEVVYAYMDSNSCWNSASTIVRIHEEVLPVDVFPLPVTIQGQELQAWIDTSGNGTFVSGDQVTGYTFQWMAINNGIHSEILSGQNWNVFIPWIDQDSVYVQITDLNGCKRSSPVYVIYWWSIPEEGTELLILFPNPAVDQLQFSAFPVESSFVIVDITGRNVLEGSLYPDQGKLNITNLISGNYLLRIQNEDGQYIGRFIKL